MLTPPRHPSGCGKRTAGPDVVMADGDSVLAADKQAARESCRTVLRRAPDIPRGVRINAPSTPDGARDLLALGECSHRPQFVLVPKVESARDIETVAGILDTGDYCPQILALIETPRAIENIASIVKAARLAGVAFGAADFAAETGCRQTWEAMLYARSALVNSAMARGVPALDSPFFELHDLEGLARESQRAKDLGYCGKGAVHPRQVPVIDAAFRPTPAQTNAALAVLAAAQASGGSITSVGGAMVGRPSSSRLSRLERSGPARARGVRPGSSRRTVMITLPPRVPTSADGEDRYRETAGRPSELQIGRIIGTAQATVETDNLLMVALTGNAARSTSTPITAGRPIKPSSAGSSPGHRGRHERALHQRLTVANLSVTDIVRASSCRLPSTPRPRSSTKRASTSRPQQCRHRPHQRPEPAPQTRRRLHPQLPGARRPRRPAPTTGY
jgi:citrate lyase subunit beta/citryl-CoA lyase/(S)-citramalyl-CoA lyase